MSALDEHLKKHRQRIIDREEKTFRELIAAYREIEKELAKSYAELQQKIEEAQANGEEISPSWFFRENRFKTLLAEVNNQITRFGGTATKIIEREQREAIKIAVEQSQETFKFLISEAENLPDIKNFGGSLNTRAVETAVGTMGDGSPLASYFEQQLAPMVAEKIKSEVIKAAVTGTNFSTIAKRLQETGGITRHRAFSVARTEVNRVRRETTRQIYQENSDIVSGWEWVSSKSTRTCPLCLAMDGEIFALDKPFPQHINCRCSLIPILKGLKQPARTIGKDWFEQQPDAVKEDILGKEAFAAYRDHNLNLNDFVAFRNDKRFGQSVTRKPLAKILADKGITDEPKFEELLLPSNITVDYERGTKTRLKNLLGKNISDDQLGAMVGALSDATVEVSFDAEDNEDKQKLFFTVIHPQVLGQQRTLGRDDDGRLYFHNDYFETQPTAPKGTGLKSFTTQALNAKKFGVEYIHTYAAGYYGHRSMNGYYTWARFGYNAELTSYDKSKLPEKYADIEDLNELIKAGGKDDWKEHGDGRDMYFDLSDDSRSLEILEDYLRERRFIVKF